jgi:hypothetical protein
MFDGTNAMFETPYPSIEIHACMYVCPMYVLPNMWGINFDVLPQLTRWADGIHSFLHSIAYATRIGWMDSCMHA